MKLHSLLCLAITLMITSNLAAQENRFTQWDKNKDGKLIKAELPEGIQKNFEKVDTDSDGFISLKEHQAFVGRNRKPASENQQRRAPAGVKIVKDLSYVKVDNPRQMLDLVLPEKRESDRPLPLLVFIHGGGWQNGNKTSGINRLVPYVQSGKYAAATIAYRLSDEAQWPSQINDCKAGIRWLKANAKEYGYDANRIAVWGTSAGGHLVAMLGVSAGDKLLDGNIGPHADQSTAVTCVVDFFGPTDLLTMNDKPGKMDHNAPDSPESKMIGGPIQENKEKTNNASPLHHVSKDDAPILIMHGTADPLVPHDQSVRFHEKLLKAGVDSTLVTITDGGHGFGGPEVEKRVRAFLDKHLRDEKTEVKTEAIKLPPRGRR